MVESLVYYQIGVFKCINVIKYKIQYINIYTIFEKKKIRTYNIKIL